MFQIYLSASFPSSGTALHVSGNPFGFVKRKRNTSTDFYQNHSPEISGRDVCKNSAYGLWDFEGLNQTLYFYTHITPEGIVKIENRKTCENSPVHLLPHSPFHFCGGFSNKVIYTYLYLYTGGSSMIACAIGAAKKPKPGSQFATPSSPGTLPGHLGTPTGETGTPGSFSSITLAIPSIYGDIPGLSGGIPGLINPKLLSTEAIPVSMGTRPGSPGMATRATGICPHKVRKLQIKSHKNKPKKGRL